MPYTPPPTARIPAAGLPDTAEARRILAARRRDAAPGSAVARDLAWLAALDARHGDDPLPGRRATVARALRANAWWFGDRGAPRQRVILRDPDGVLLTYRGGHGFMVNPVATTGRWRDLNDELAPEELAGPLMEMAVARVRDGRRMLTWEYYDVAGRPDEVRPGLSGMAQARLAETLSSAYLRTGDVRYAEAAGDALAALEVPVDEGGVLSRVAWPPGTAAHPWYVERAYPGDDPWRGAALNGFMVALLSLRSSAVRLETPPDAGPDAAAPPSPGVPAGPDAAGATPADPAAPPPRTLEPPPAAVRAAARARRLERAGLETLQALLPAHDTGDWSLYGIVSPGRAPRTYLADLNYHCYHVHLLRSLARTAPERGFDRTADLWQRYVDDRGAVCPPR